MPNSSFRELWRSQRPLLGTWCTIPSPYCAELLASVGFDWVCVDLQHGLIGEELLPTVLQATALTGTATLVRTRDNSDAAITRALDAGAAGVIVPYVDSADDATVAVRACRYPPIGERSWGAMRPLVAGMPEPISDEDVVCVVMVETVAAVEAIDSICAVKGVDGVFLGPADLSLSAAGKLGAPLRESVDRVSSACRKAGIMCGIACASPTGVNDACESGLRLLTVGWDVAMLSAEAKAALETARVAIAGSADSLRSA